MRQEAGSRKVGGGRQKVNKGEMPVTMFLFWIPQGKGLLHPVSRSPFPSTLTAVLGGRLLSLTSLARNVGAQEVE